MMWKWTIERIGGPKKEICTILLNVIPMFEQDVSKDNIVWRCNNTKKKVIKWSLKTCTCK